MNLGFRRGTPADAASLADLAARTFHETFAAQNRPEDIALHLTQTYGVRQQTAELLDPQIITILAEIDAQLVGYAQLRVSAPPDCVTGAAPLELWRFYVVRPWHGQGIAQALMQQVNAEARVRDAGALWLGVWERNERAKAFYRKCGFADVGSHVFMVGTDPQIDRIFVRSFVNFSPPAAEPTL